MHKSENYGQEETNISPALEENENAAPGNTPLFPEFSALEDPNESKQTNALYDLRTVIRRRTIIRSLRWAFIPLVGLIIAAVTLIRILRRKDYTDELFTYYTAYDVRNMTKKMRASYLQGDDSRGILALIRQEQNWFRFKLRQTITALIGFAGTILIGFIAYAIASAAVSRGSGIRFGIFLNLNVQLSQPASYFLEAAGLFWIISCVVILGFYLGLILLTRPYFARLTKAFYGKEKPSPDDFPLYHTNDPVAVLKEASKVREGKEAKILYSVSATFLAGLLVFILSVSVLLGTNIFYAGKLRGIGLGDSLYRVGQVLGKPDGEENNAWIYMTDNFVSLRRKADKLEKRLLNTTDASRFEKIMDEIFALDQKAQKMTYRTIRVQFSSDAHVTRVEMIHYEIEEETGGFKLRERTIASNKCSVIRSDGAVSVIYRTEFSDGSYVCAPMPAYALEDVNFSKTGSYRLTWYDVTFGELSGTLNVYI